jgi:PAS domain S-box-containing protein
MDMRSLFSALSLAAVFVYIYIGIFTYRQNKASSIHKTFLSLCASYAIWSFAYAFAYISNDGYVFSFWNKISAIGWCSFSAITLFLTLLITEKSILRKRIVVYLILFPAVLFFFMAVFLFGQGVNTPAVISNFFYIGDFLYDFTYLLMSIVVVFIWGLKSKSVRIKKQSKVLVLSSIIPFVLNLLTQTILPLFGVSNIPLMGQIYAIIMILGVYLVITKYKFLRLPEKFIVDEIAKEMLDMVVIIDDKGRIIRLSKHTLDMTGFNADELLRQQMNFIVDEKGSEISLDIIREKDHKYDDVNLIKKNGEKIPVNVSVKRIFDSRLQDYLGAILVIQDISLLYELQSKNEELRTTLLSVGDGVISTDRQGNIKLIN